MRPGFRAVTFASVAVTLRAFVQVDLPRRMQVGFRGGQGILEVLVFRRNDPRLALLDHPVGNDQESENEDSGKKNFASFKGARGVREHERKKFRIVAVPNKSVTKQLGAAEDEPEKFGVEEEDRGSRDPGEDCADARVGKFAHF